MSVERSSHPTSAQLEALLDLMEKYPELAKGFSKTKNARERNQRLWQQLAVRLNSMGGTIKSYKQWTKYWADKKSAIRKKVAAQSAARRRTGGGVEDVVELSEVEERIVALFGGAGFGTGDTHLGIQPFPENDSPEQQLVGILPSSSNAVSNSPQIAQSLELRSAAEETLQVVLTPENQRGISQIARRLFVDSEDVLHSEPNQSNQQDSRLEPTLSRSTSPLPIYIASPSRYGTTGNQMSQSILYSIHREPHPSPPPLTLSHTPSPLPMPDASRSRREATATNISHMVQASEQIGSSSSCYAQPPTPLQSATPASISIASPSRRGATVTNTSCSRSAHRSRGDVPLSRSSRPAIAPSQRRTEFSRITERFLQVEEQQLEIQRSNTRVLQTIVEQSVQRDRALAEAVTAVGEGLKALAEAIKQNRSQ